jgi:hypothetical protein
MHHFIESDPYLIRERNHQIFNEVQALRFEKRPRKSHKVGGSRLAAFTLFLKSTLHPLRGTHMIGREIIDADEEGELPALQSKVFLRISNPVGSQSEENRKRDKGSNRSIHRPSSLTEGR